MAAVAPRVGHRVYERDGFWITLWTYYDSVASPGLQPADYAAALKRLHAGLRNLDVITPHFTDRVAEAHQLVARPEETPALADADRELLDSTLRSVTLRSPAEAPPSRCCMASHTQATCSTRRAGRSSSTSRPFVADPSNSISPMYRTRSATAIPASIRNCSANSVGLFSRWSRRGALTGPTTAERRPSGAPTHRRPSAGSAVPVARLDDGRLLRCARCERSASNRVTFAVAERRCFPGDLQAVAAFGRVGERVPDAPPGQQMISSGRARTSRLVRRSRRSSDLTRRTRPGPRRSTPGRRVRWAGRYRSRFPRTTSSWPNPPTRVCVASNRRTDAGSGVRSTRHGPLVAGDGFAGWPMHFVMP